MKVDIINNDFQEGNRMPDAKNPRLTSAEIAAVWGCYINNTLSICVLKYFLAHVDDSDIESVLKFALKISEANLKWSTELLERDQHPKPIGFTDDDVNLTAPRLFSDAFYLYYLNNMAKVGLSVYGVALATSAKMEVRRFLSDALTTSTELYNKVAETLLTKGQYIRPPYVKTSDHIDFIDNKSYLGGILSFSKRPLNVVEITHIDANIKTNNVGKALLTALAQCAKSKKVREFCTTGKEIAKKHVDVFASFLKADDLQAPMSSDLEVTDSTIAPFSDKLIMFHTTLLIQSSLSNYATAAAASLREDISTAYVRLSAESVSFAKNGIDIMIKNQWLEQPPQIPDHRDLAEK
jgi:hypothetical protein